MRRTSEPSEKQKPDSRHKTRSTSDSKPGARQDTRHRHQTQDRRQRDKDKALDTKRDRDKALDTKRDRDRDKAPCTRRKSADGRRKTKIIHYGPASRGKYWATHSSVRSFAPFFAPLATLARSGESEPLDVGKSGCSEPWCHGDLRSKAQ